MKSKVFLIISVLVLLTALVTGIYMFKTLGKNSYMTATVTTVESSAETKGFMVLSEEVVDISGANFRRVYYKDGAKVGKNAKIISLYNNASDGNMIAELEEIEKKLNSFSDDYVNLTANDALKIKKHIDDGIDKMGTSAYKGRLYETKAEAEKVNTLFSIKHSSGNAAKKNEAELLREKAFLERQLSSDKTDVLSPISGIFVGRTDGYEGLIDKNRALSLSVGEFNALMKEEREGNDSRCKIVDNYRWYMACTIPSDKLLSSEVGKRISLKTDDGKNITAEILYISEPEDGKCVVTFTSNDDFYGIDKSRKVDVKAVFEKITGFVVPTRAFHMYNGEYGVFTEQNGKLKFKKTSVIYSSEEYSVVPRDGGGLSLYDTILVDGDLSEFYD